MESWLWISERIDRKNGRLSQDCVLYVITAIFSNESGINVRLNDML